MKVRLRSGTYFPLDSFNERAVPLEDFLLHLAPIEVGYGKFLSVLVADVSVRVELLFRHARDTEVRIVESAHPSLFFNQSDFCRHQFYAARFLTRLADCGGDDAGLGLFGSVRYGSNCGPTVPIFHAAARKLPMCIGERLIDYQHGSCWRNYVYRHGAQIRSAPRSPYACAHRH